MKNKFTLLAFLFCFISTLGAAPNDVIITQKDANGANKRIALSDPGVGNWVVQWNDTTNQLEYVNLAGGGDALTGNPLSQFAATSSSQLAGVLSDESGTGLSIFNDNPTILGPILSPLVVTPPAAPGYLTGTVYGLGDYVTHENTIFQSLQAGNQGNDPGVVLGVAGWRAWWEPWVVQGFHWDFVKNDLFQNNDRSIILAPGVTCANWHYIYDEILRELPSAAAQPFNSELGWEELGRVGTINFGRGPYVFERPLRQPPLVSLTGVPRSREIGSTIQASATAWQGADAVADENYLIHGIYRDGSVANTNFGTSIRNLYIDPQSTVTFAGGVWWAASEGSVFDENKVINYGDATTASGLFLPTSTDVVSISNSSFTGDGTFVSEDDWPGTAITLSTNSQAVKIFNITTLKVGTGIKAFSARALTIHGYEAEKTNIAFDSSTISAEGITITGFYTKSFHVNDDIMMHVGYGTNGRNFNVMGYTMTDGPTDPQFNTIRLYDLVGMTTEDVTVAAGTAAKGFEFDLKTHLFGAPTVTVVDSTDATSFVSIFDSATGTLAPKTDGALLYDATTGTLTTTTFAGALSGTLGGMLDVNGFAIGDGTLELLDFAETASAVNQLRVTNAATGTGPILSAVGDDANINLNLLPKGTGEVGVGTTTPSTLLHVNRNGNTSEYIRIENTTGGANSIAGMQVYGNNTDLAIYSHAAARTATRYGITLGGYSEINSGQLASGTNGIIIGTDIYDKPIIFGGNSLERMRIAAGGSVGIGTPTPATALEVVGTVTATAFAGPLTGNADTATTATTANALNVTADLDLAGFDLLNGGNLDLTTLGVAGAVTVGNLQLTEKAAAGAPVAGKGEIWVKTATPNELYFTDDAGTDFQLGAGGGGTTILKSMKTANESRNTTTTLADDADLTVTLAANTRYSFRMVGFVVAANATPDIKLHLAGPAGTVYKAANTHDVTGNYRTHANDIIMTTITTTPQIFDISGYVKTAGTAGAMTIQWAQNVSDAGDTTLEEGTWIHLVAE